MAELKIPEGLYYSKSDEWLKLEGDIATLGITDYAQDALNDIVYVEFGSVGDRLEAGDSYGSVESVKAQSDLYTPVAGEIIEVNEALEDNSEIINADPYGKGWMVRLRVSGAPDLSELMSASEYAAYCENR